MMRLWPRVRSFVLALVFLSIAVLCATDSTPAQSDTEPRTVPNACMGNCVVDVNFLHAGMGDTQAKNAFHAWYDTYYTLTGCDDPAWKTDLFFLLDVAGEIVGAPGAPTLQCWQGLMGQASLCADSCAEYFIPHAKYAPNVRLTLGAGQPGLLEVTLDNDANLNSLPELQPNAYSRQFHLLTTLQREGGSALLVNDTAMPSLSFPNWVTRGGYSDCASAYGADADRCRLLDGLNTPSEASAAVEFLDGVLYDLSGQVDDLSDASGSFSADGFVRLLSNNDSLTINQGDFAGYVWVKTHNLSENTHTQQLIPWDAQNQPVTIVNHECNSWLSTCWITGDRTESDAYVFALRGPAEKRLEGSYTITVSAEIQHDKDILDNRASYSYDAAAAGGVGDAQDGVEPPGEGISVSDLPVIELPGPGVYPNSLPAQGPGLLYRLDVPPGVRFLFVQLESLDGGPFSYFVRRGAIPVPDYPQIFEDYHCWSQSDADYAGGCPFPQPYPDAYYIFVSRLQGTSFQLKVEWSTSADAATPTAQPTPPAGGGLSSGFSEVEVNDGRATANAWDLQQPFTGQVSRYADRDYVLLNIPQPGIYTFTLSDTGPDLRAKLTLVRTSSGNSIDTSRASAKGQPVSLTFDGSAGEQYNLIVAAAEMTSGAANQPYRLTLSGFIPDPDEPNDERATATFWDVAQGPALGYFWDTTTGRADYFRLVAPPTQAGTEVSFQLSNPAPDLRVRLTLINAVGLFQENTPYSAPGQPVTLSRALEANKEYYLKLESMDNKTSLQPYTLSASYSPASTQTGPTETGRPVRLHGIVFNQGSLLPGPIRDVEIYAQVAGQPAVLLDTTGVLGTYSETIQIAEGQDVRIWAVRPGFTFQPEQDVWSPDPRQRSHRSVFSVIGAQLIQATPTPPPASAETPLPPLLPTLPATLAAQTPTLPAAQGETSISGSVWRLFPQSPAAGVGAARLILSVNGVEQPPVLSGIDGSYSLSVPGLRVGDQLSLRAEGDEDQFEPSAYQWQAEAGVSVWTYDFYSYWGEITTSAPDDQNRLYGRVTGSQGQGVAGVYVVVQMGTSDALQRLGPTDANGFFDGYVRLPARAMVTVWVEGGGYAPSRAQFFHAYQPEDRAINFTQIPAQGK